jgi:hypothetical protein
MKRRILTDETDRMDLDAGTWRSPLFIPPPEVDKPTYGTVGPVERYDERDHVFSRIAMKGGSPQFEDYYHPLNSRTITSGTLKRKRLMRKTSSAIEN